MKADNEKEDEEGNQSKHLETDHYELAITMLQLFLAINC